LCLIGLLAAAVLGNAPEQGRERPDDKPLLTEDDIKSLAAYPKSFTLADYHITLIRQAVISWDFVEIGAPTIDPERPFGAVSTRAAIARAAKIGSRQTPAERSWSLLGDL